MSFNVESVLANFDDSKRILARLMARENLSVVIMDGLSTASFDPVHRVLRIPNWSTLTRAQFDLLIGHEVGHALFTESTFIETVTKGKPGLMRYFNVVEDARIERKMKNVYPGLARDFYEGYQTFTQNGPLLKLDATGTSIINRRGQARKIASMRLIDRINLFFKVGAFVSVPFDNTEHVWLRRIQTCPDMATALQIATELYAYAKEREQQHDEQLKKSGVKRKPLSGTPDERESKGDETPNDDDGESEPEDGDEDETESGAESDDDHGGAADDTEDTDDGAASDGDDGDDSDSRTSKDPTSETDEDAEEALKELAKRNEHRQSMRHLMYGTLTDTMLQPRVIPAGQWVSDVYAAMRLHRLSDVELQRHLDTLESKWNEQFMQTAKSMAAEFDRRKTAKNYQRAVTSKTGRLDMTKLHQYKFAEDLFMRTTVVSNGQSHGFVMIIDGSSSMEGVFSNVLDQAMLFAVFCYYAKIPCEVYLFSDARSVSTQPSMGLMTVALAPKGQLVGMVNTVTHRGSFRQQLRACLAFKAAFNRESSVTDPRFYETVASLPFANLSGTPLYTGIMLGEAMVARMKRNLRLDKMTFAVVSDGGDTDGVFFQDNTVSARGTLSSKMEAVAACRGMVVRDIVTKENHIHVTVAGGSTRMPRNAVLTMLLDVIRKRHDAQTVYFYLSSGEPSSALDAHVREGREDALPDSDSVDRFVREHGQFVFPAGSGVAGLTMILPTSALVLKGDASPASGANYVDVLKDRQNSRKFINAVVPHLA